MSSIFLTKNLNLTGLENLFKMQITWAKKKMSHRAKCSTHLTEKNSCDDKRLKERVQIVFEGAFFFNDFMKYRAILRNCP